MQVLYIFAVTLTMYPDLSRKIKLLNDGTGFG